MKSQPTRLAEMGRVTIGPYGSCAVNGCNGAFLFQADSGYCLKVIASNGGGWDHVSVSVMGHNRCPTWEEMDFVRRQFWRDDETVLQIHPPRIMHVNCHPFCLHLWRPQNVEIPLPPTVMIGPRDQVEYDLAMRSMR